MEEYENKRGITKKEHFGIWQHPGADICYGILDAFEKALLQDGVTDEDKERFVWDSILSAFESGCEVGYNMTEGDLEEAGLAFEDYVSTVGYAS